MLVSGRVPVKLNPMGFQSELSQFLLPKNPEAIPKIRDGLMVEKIPSHIQVFSDFFSGNIPDSLGHLWSFLLGGSSHLVNG